MEDVTVQTITYKCWDFFVWSFLLYLLKELFIQNRHFTHFLIKREILQNWQKRNKTHDESTLMKPNKPYDGDVLCFWKQNSLRAGIWIWILEPRLEYHQGDAVAARRKWVELRSWVKCSLKKQTLEASVSRSRPQTSGWRLNYAAGRPHFTPHGGRRVGGNLPSPSLAE